MHVTTREPAPKKRRSDSSETADRFVKMKESVSRSSRLEVVRRISLTGQESRWGERIQQRDRKELRTRGEVCECACKSIGGGEVGEKSSAMRLRERRRERSIRYKEGSEYTGLRTKGDRRF